MAWVVSLDSNPVSYSRFSETLAVLRAGCASEAGIRRCGKVILQRWPIGALLACQLLPLTEVLHALDDVALTTEFKSHKGCHAQAVPLLVMGAAAEKIGPRQFWEDDLQWLPNAPLLARQRPSLTELPHAKAKAQGLPCTGNSRAGGGIRC